MFGPADLDRLTAAMRANGVTVLTVRKGDRRLRLVLAPGGSAQPEAQGPASRPAKAAPSPGIGTFLPRGEDDGLPPLDRTVVAGELLGYVRQGHALLPVVAPAAGRLTGDLPAEGAPAGYGDPLYTVETGR